MKAAESGMSKEELKKLVVGVFVYISPKMKASMEQTVIAENAAKTRKQIKVEDQPVAVPESEVDALQMNEDEGGEEEQPEDDPEQ